jgi:hypothetical protein
MAVVYNISHPLSFILFGCGPAALEAGGFWAYMNITRRKD